MNINFKYNAMHVKSYKKIKFNLLKIRKLSLIILGIVLVYPCNSANIDIFEDEILSAPDSATIFGSNKNDNFFFEEKQIGDKDYLISDALKEIEKNNIEYGLEKLLQVWESSENKEINVGIKIATLYLNQKRYKEALNFSKKLDNIFPNDYRCLTLIGVSQVGLGDILLAKTAFLKAMEVNTKAIDASINLAQIYEMEKEYNKAISVYEESIKNSPDNDQININLSKLYYKLGRVDESVDVLRKMIDSKPQSKLSYYVLSNIYIVKKDYKSARKIIDEAVKNFSYTPEFLGVNGILTLMEGEVDKAIIFLKASVEYYPINSTRYYLARAYEVTRQNGLALEQVDTILSNDPKNDAARLVKARLLYNMGKKELAETELNQLLNLYPENLQLIKLKEQLNSKSQSNIDGLKEWLAKSDNNISVIHTATSYYEKQNQEKAFEILTDWLDKHPSDIHVRKLYANLLLKSHDYDEAEKQYEFILSEHKDDVESLNNIAIVLLQKQDFDEAILYAKQAYNKMPYKPEIMDTLGYSLLKKGEDEEAYELLKKAALLLPSNGTVQFHYASVLSELDKTEDAINVIHNLSNNDFPEKKEMKRLLDELNRK